MKASQEGHCFRVSIIAIMIFQVCALFMRSALDLYLVRRGIDPAVAKDLSYLVVPPLLAMLLFPYLKEYRKALLNLFDSTNLTVRLILLSTVTGILLRVTYWASLTSLMWLGIVQNDNPDAIEGPILGFHCPPMVVLALSLVVMSLLVPLVEEVINRGLVLHVLLARGTILGVVVSAILFALMHPPSMYLIAFCGGTLLAVQMLSFRTLWAPVITHASYNAAATFQWDCFEFIWNPSSSDPALVQMGQVATPVAVFGAGLCCWLVSSKAVGAVTPRPPVST